MISMKKDLIDLDNQLNLAPRRAKKTVNQRANVTQCSNYLPQRAEIWMIQRSHLAPQWAFR